MDFKGNWWDIRMRPDSSSPFSPPGRNRSAEAAVVVLVVAVVALTIYTAINWKKPKNV
jgi:hypothetical protein